MARQLVRLSNMFFNKPLLLAQEEGLIYADYLLARNSGEIEFSVKNPEVKSKRQATFDKERLLGVIPINGSITSKVSFDLCDGETASYEKLEQDFNALIKAGAKTIVIEADSGGGEAYRMMETSRYLRRTADENGVKLIAYVDGRAHSAMYGLVTAAHEIIANKDSKVGSIGVLVSLMSDLKKRIQEGMDVQFVTAGKNKIPFAEDGSFTKEFKETLQKDVDHLYKQFKGLVTEHRGVSDVSLEELGANTFQVEEALEHGLIDKVMTHEQYRNYIDEITLGKNNNMSILKTAEQQAASLEEMQSKLSQAEELTSVLSSEVEKSKSALESLVAQNKELQDKLAEKEKEVLETKEADRKEKLQDVVGTEKFAETYELVEGMSDEKFTKFLEVLKSKPVPMNMGTELGEEGTPVAKEVLKGVDALAARLKSKQ
jgi:ClpP class serine protease